MSFILLAGVFASGICVFLFAAFVLLLLWLFFCFCVVFDLYVCIFCLFLRCHFCCILKFEAMCLDSGLGVCKFLLGMFQLAMLFVVFLALCVLIGDLWSYILFRTNDI